MVESKDHVTKWSALIGQLENWGGGQNHPPQKALEGLYGQTRKAVIGSTCFFNDVINKVYMSNNKSVF